MNAYYESLIEQLKEANGGNEDEVIAFLRSVGEGIGEDLSESEVRSFVKFLLTDEDGVESEDEEYDEEYMKRTTAVVKEFLDDKDFHYYTLAEEKDITVYELRFSLGKATFNVRIFVEDNPKACIIKGIYPFNADSVYEYPVLKVLAKESARRRFGAFCYDEDDGEITYKIAFLTEHGIIKDDLEDYFTAVVQSMRDCHDAILKGSVGRFSSNTVDELLKNVEALVNDITE